jgi:hypothetical protein
MVEGGGKDCIDTVALLISNPIRNLKMPVGDALERVKFPRPISGFSARLSCLAFEIHYYPQMSLKCSRGQNVLADFCGAK